MTSRQLAAYLSVNERTVLKLVQDGELPGVKVGNQWRFRRAMVDAWLDDQALGLAPRTVAPPVAPAVLPQLLTLAACFSAMQVLPALKSRTKTGAVGELADFAASLGLVRDADWFLGALIKRENVLPTATGRGLAFLHTLHRHPEQVERPFLLLGRSHPGIDFDALDGQPVHLFFVLGLRYQELHLPWLSKLVQMLAQPDLIEHLRSAADAEAIAVLLASAEQDLGERRVTVSA